MPLENFPGVATPNPSLKNNAYIYHIRVGNSLYIGQTLRGEAVTRGNRINEHIYQAFYTGNQELKYQEMRQLPLMDWQISFYTKEMGYGVPDLETKYAAFAADFAPKNRKRDDNNPSEQDLLDFAEIYHILVATQESVLLTNAEMGGKPNGYICVRPGSPLYGQQVLFRHTNPYTAYKLATMDYDSTAVKAGATTLVYQELFSPNWPDIYESKYKADMERQNKTLSKKGLMTWQEFFSGPFIKKITHELALTIYAAFKQDRNGYNMTPVIQKFVREEFLEPKREAAWQIVKTYYRQRNLKINFNLKDRFDFSRLDEYITEVLRRFLKGISYTLKNGDAAAIKESKQGHWQEFIPVNIAPVWDLSHFKSEPNEWLTGTYQPESSALHAAPEYLKRRSYLIFRQAMKETAVHPAELGVPLETVAQYQLGRDEEEGQRYYMSALESGDWLSARLRKWYMTHGPGYAYSDWLTFYKPMVDVYRTQQGYSPFQPVHFTLGDVATRTDKAHYRTPTDSEWDTPGGHWSSKFYTRMRKEPGTILVYQNESAVNWGSGTFDTLTIY